MKASRLLVSILTAVVAAGVLLVPGNYFPETQAGTVTAAASSASLLKGKPMPWIPLLLLGDSETYTIVIAPQSLLFTAPGQTSQLTATVYDKDGLQVDRKVRWSSSNPQAVTVDEDGVITSSVWVGSATITASFGTSVSNTVMVLVADPADGAVLVSDDQVVGAVTPVDPDAPLGVGMQVNVRLSGIAPPAPGTVVLGTGEQPVGGKVVSAVQDGDDVEAVLETIPLDEMFEELFINEEIDLSREVPTIAKFFADNYDVSWEPGGALEFTLRKTVQSSALASSALMSRTGVPMGTQVLNPNANNGPFYCEGGAPFVLDGLPLGLSVTPRLTWLFHYDSTQGGLKSLLLAGEITGTFKVGLTFNVALSTKVTCTTNWGEIPFPLAASGPLSTTALYVPLGMGFEVDGKISLPQLGYELQTDAKSSVVFGAHCLGGNCSMVNYLDPEAKTVHGWKTPDVSGTLLGVLSQLRLEPSMSGYLFSGLNLGAIPQLNIPARAKILKAQVGVKLAGNFALVEGQMADEGYSSDYLLSEYSFLGAGLEITALGGLLQANLYQPKVEFNDPLAESPKVLVAVSDVKDFVTGDTVTFTVSLDPQHINYPVIGYNVGKVSIYRRTEDDIGGVGPADLLVEVVPANGVTDVQMTWTADVDGTIDGDYFAFVETKALPFPYFGELETATITTGGYGCIYGKLGDGVSTNHYTKHCYNEIADERTVLIHDYGSSVDWGDTINMSYTDVASDYSATTWWVNYSNFPTGGYDCVESGAGWTTYRTRTQPATGSGVSENFSLGSDTFPAGYYHTNLGRDGCWPGYNVNTSSCGTYDCPPINSIVPLMPFPGDCHVWWDHFDEQGVWHACSY